MQADPYAYSSPGFTDSGSGSDEYTPVKSRNRKLAGSSTVPKRGAGVSKQPLIDPPLNHKRIRKPQKGVVAGGGQTLAFEYGDDLMEGGEDGGPSVLAHPVKRGEGVVKRKGNNAKKRTKPVVKPAQKGAAKGGAHKKAGKGGKKLPVVESSEEEEDASESSAYSEGTSKEGGNINYNGSALGKHAIQAHTGNDKSGKSVKAGKRSAGTVGRGSEEGIEDSEGDEVSDRDIPLPSKRFKIAAADTQHHTRKSTAKSSAKPATKPSTKPSTKPPTKPAAAATPTAASGGPGSSIQALEPLANTLQRPEKTYSRARASKQGDHIALVDEGASRKRKGGRSRGVTGGSEGAAAKRAARKVWWSMHC